MASQHPDLFALFPWILFILLMQSVNVAQFLNITPLFLSSNLFVASSPATGLSAVVIVLFHKYIYITIIT